MTRGLLIFALASAQIATLHAGGDRPMNWRTAENARRLAPSWVLDLKPGVPHTFETRNLAKGCDTVLLILDDGHPLEWNDDRDPKPSDKRHVAESALEFTATRRAPHTLQVRAKMGTLEGACDVYMDGKLLAKQIKFGALWRYRARTPMPMPVTVPDVKPQYIDLYEEEHPDR